MATAAIGFALPIPFMDNFYLVCLMIWCLLFVGGFVLPPITGMMINSVEEKYRTSANSIANMIYNLFGYLPGPFIYGLVSEISPPTHSRIAMGQLLYSVAGPVLLLWFGIFYQIYNGDKRKFAAVFQRKNGAKDL